MNTEFQLNRYILYCGDTTQKEAAVLLKSLYTKSGIEIDITCSGLFRL